MALSLSSSRLSARVGLRAQRPAVRSLVVKASYDKKVAAASH